MVQSDIDLLEYHRSYRYWWLWTLFILAGGAAGWIFHRIQPPVYEAQASLTVIVDYSQTGNFSAYNVDLAVGAIQGVFFASPVIQPLIQQAQVPAVEVFDVFKMERFGDVWKLRVRHTDPQVAANLANQWAESGFQALQEAHAHAMRARTLSRYLNSLAGCPKVPEYIPAVPPICYGAFTLNPDTINTIQERLQEEQLLSKSINAFLLFSLDAPAQPPKAPVMYQRNWLLLAGMILGFLVALVFFSIRSARLGGEQTP